MKKFALIVVPTRENAYHSLQDFPGIIMPVGLISIGAVLEKQGCRVKIFDGDAENWSFEEALRQVSAFAPDYAGSTCMTATMDITYKFFSELKKRSPQTTVIVGGPHVSALPKKTLEESADIDIVIKGEGDQSIVELIKAMKANSDLSSIKGIAFRSKEGIVETQGRELIRDLDSLPMPALHLIKYDLYRSYLWNKWVSGRRKPIGVIFTGRGCFGRCNFCASKVVFGRGIRYFGLERIKKEIDFLVHKYKVKILYFMDDTFTANRKLVNDVCDYLMEKGYHKRLEINVSARADTADFATLRKMRKAGIRWLFFGVESGNQGVLDRIGKNITIEQVRSAFKKARRSGMFVGGNFMIGNLSETYETVLDTINLACALKQDFVSFTVTVPLPGTELYDYCKKSGIKLPGWNNFGSVNSEPIVLNKGLDSARLKELRALAISRFFKRPGYVLRTVWRFRRPSVITDFAKMYLALKKEMKENRY